MTLTHENDSAVTVLREKMDSFYASTVDYTAFQAPSEHPQEWCHVKDAIAEIAEKRPSGQKCRVLEFGAGRTGFPQYLSETRDAVHFTAQDVTPINAEYLRTVADEAHVGPLDGLKGKFDVIFSTFVLEHVSDPKHTLETLLNLLEPGGFLLLFCPCYDVPFYLSHSADHYHWLRRFGLGLVVCWRRAITLLTRRPAFVIHSNPAVLHMNWSIDRDAIHWASLIDLRAFLGKRGTIENLVISSGSFKDWFVKSYLRINIRFRSHAS